MRKRDIFIAIGAVAAAGILALSTLFFTPVQTGAWGLGFSQPGQSPSAPVTPTQLQKYNAAYLGNTQEKVLYLTFDAGYENGYTPQLLSTLEKHKAPAAFFLVANYMEKNPELVRQMVDQGHIVANHTMHHPDMSQIRDIEAFSKELTDLEALFTQITGKELPKYYRPPQGVYSQENLEMAQSLGYRTVFWSLAYADWDNQNQPSREQALEKLQSRTHNGAVVLLHATSATNAAILDELLTYWEGEGYRFAPISELFHSD